MQKRLTKSREKVFSGVCGGVADYIGVDPTIVRLIWAVMTLVYGLGLILYIAMVIVMPEAPEVRGATSNSGEDAGAMADDDDIVVELAPPRGPDSDDNGANRQTEETGSSDIREEQRRKKGWRHVHSGVVWITLGLLILLFNLDVLQFPVARTLLVFWPVFLIGAGLSMMFRRWPVMETVVFLLTVALFVALGTHLGTGQLPFSGRHSVQYIDSAQGTLAPGDVVTLDLDVHFVNGTVDAQEMDGDQLYVMRSNQLQMRGTFDEQRQTLVVRDADQGPGRVFMPFQERGFRLTLNEDVFWNVEGRLNLGRLTWDLSGVKLNGLQLEGNVSEMTIMLPEPDGTVHVDVRANVSELTLVLPSDADYQVQGSKNLGQLTVDGQPLSVRQRSDHYNQSDDRYNITAESSVANIRIRFDD